MNDITNDQKWMAHAFELAKKAEQLGEVPVGAIIVKDDQLIGEGWNQPISNNDPSAHAEIIALRHAAKNLDNYRLLDTTLYVTLEPCTMCVGAIIHARVKHLVFGAHDLKTGAVSSKFNILNSDGHNHKVICREGVMSQECSEILSEFFSKRRAN